MKINHWKKSVSTFSWFLKIISFFIILLFFILLLLRLLVSLESINFHVSRRSIFCCLFYPCHLHNSLSIEKNRLWSWKHFFITEFVFLSKKHISKKKIETILSLKVEWWRDNYLFFSFLFFLFFCFWFHFLFPYFFLQVHLFIFVDLFLPLS